MSIIICLLECKPVYNLLCPDVDECEQGISTCDSLCQNTIGSYRCACQTGYVLNRDGKTCRGKHCLIIYCTFTSSLYCRTCFSKLQYWPPIFIGSPAYNSCWPFMRSISFDLSRWYLANIWTRSDRRVPYKNSPSFSWSSPLVGNKVFITPIPFLIILIILRYLVGVK